MSKKNHEITLEEIRNLDLVEYLSVLGYVACRISSNNYWYFSPFRNENVPSFKINRKLNRWFDFGLGYGGNLIDFMVHYKGYTIEEVFIEFQHTRRHQKKNVDLYPKKDHKPENKLHILEKRTLYSENLLQYLQNRKISIQIADQYCIELKYRVNNKIFQAIGFQNDSQGYEIRNPIFKGSSSPKDISSFRNGAKNITVFEGFMDFLTYKTMLVEQPENKMDFLILNSISFFEKARNKIETYESIYLYLDNDSTGKKITQYALSLNKKYIDKSFLYKDQKDLNEWAVHIDSIKKTKTSNRLKN